MSKYDTGLDAISVFTFISIIVHFFAVLILIFNFFIRPYFF